MIRPYFRIDSDTLRLKTKWNSDSETYEYRPRGFYELEYPETPYPEVTDYMDNGDGTITLTVHAVMPQKNLSRVYGHEVVIRPLADGGVQYVSNHLLPSDDNNYEKYVELWHTDRLTDEQWEEVYVGRTSVQDEMEKGYNLPIEADERKEAEEDCLQMMAMIGEMYAQADKGDASNVVLSDGVVEQIKEKTGETGEPVTAVTTYVSMGNYQVMEDFLKACESGEKGSVILYEIHSDGGIGRRKYYFDGRDMYVLCTIALWSGDGEPIISTMTLNRIKEWEYTEKGWFIYHLCVPEVPEVSEMVDGSCMIRIKPMEDECRKLSEECVKGLGYQGNNLLCSNWDRERMEDLDYNGLYEYLYEMKYQEKFDYKNYPDGIPGEEFESLMMEYLPVTAEQLRQYAVYDKEKRIYLWQRLGCQNYALNYFGTAMPEVTDVRENDDGTITLTVDAVCEMVLGDEAFITHELTVRFDEDGSFQYLGNVILGDGLKRIPDYHYRLGRE